MSLGCNLAEYLVKVGLLLRSLLGGHSKNKGYTIEQDRNYIKSIKTSLNVYFMI